MTRQSTEHGAQHTAHSTQSGMRRGILPISLAVCCALCAVCGSEATRAANASAASEPGARPPRLTKRFALELDGQLVGMLDGVAGGGVKAEVLDEQAEPDGILRKRLGQPRPQEITLQVGLAMAPAFYQWIAQTWAVGETGRQGETRRGDGATGRQGDEEHVPILRPLTPSPTRPVADSALSPSVAKSGAILELADDNTVRARREFVGARITEVTVPALDVAAKKPGFLTVRIAPESVRFVRGAGADPSGGAIRLESRTWLPCHFRVSLDGLDGSQITRVETFTVRTIVSRAASAVSESGYRRLAAGRRSTFSQPLATEERLMIQTPALSVTLAEAGADPWFDWLGAFTLRGNGEPEQEKNGAILLLSASHAELARIDLRGVGLCGLTPASSEASEGAGASAGRAYVSADLYVQRIGFRAAGSQPGEAAPSASPNPRRGLRFQSILK
jgi:hypothetical protein